jgi:hypothetical protein
MSATMLLTLYLTHALVAAFGLVIGVLLSANGRDKE